MSPKSIPTLYKGYQFRSLLEATWAAFFDILGWRWEYEPTEFSGWIPDFVLYGKSQLTYVEVKPVIAFPQAIADEIDASGCPEEVLIVGQTHSLPIYLEPVGWLREESMDSNNNPSWWWDTAVYGHWEEGNGKIGFCHSMGTFYDRISGGWEQLGGPSTNEIQRLWAQAKNTVQWKPPARR